MRTSVLAATAASVLYFAAGASAQGAPPAPPPPPPVVEPVAVPEPEIIRQAPPPPPPKAAAPRRASHGIPDLHADFTFGETTETTTTTEDWHLKMDKLTKEHAEDNRQLQAGGHNWQKGVWLYGDYKNGIPDVTTAHECADECERDSKCLHWCFELEKKRCDLRSEGGGMNEGAAHWITGHAKRWASYEKELKRRTEL